MAWTAWIGQDAGISSTTTAWTQWTSSTANTDCTTITTDLWSNWVGTATTASVTYTTNPTQIYYAWVNQREETLAERAARDQQRMADMAAAQERARQYEEQRKVEDARRKEESERAAALLAEHLSEEQKKQLAMKGEFEVEAESGKRYVIARGYAGNVYSLDEKRRKVARHCIHPIDSVPDHDAMLAQMLWLKWNESEFLKVANTTRLAA